MTPNTARLESFGPVGTGSQGSTAVRGRSTRPGTSMRRIDFATSAGRTRSARRGSLSLELPDHVRDIFRRLLERGLVRRRELELHDLLDALPPEDDRHSDEEVAKIVLALERNRARHEALLVEQDRLHH